MPDYCRLTIYEQLWIISESICITAVMGWLFFHHIIGILLLLPYAVAVYRKKRKIKLEQAKAELSGEFKEGLSSMSAAIEAGYSSDNAVGEALKDLELMYSESYIVREFRYMQRQLKNNRTVEEVLYEFGERSDLDDIRSFAEVFRITKRTGGDVLGIIHMTEQAITEKNEVMEEIRTMVTGKQLEVRIMKVVPFGVLAYINFCSPEFLAPLYSLAVGRVIMGTALILYILLSMQADRLTEFKI